jgi:serine/threonine-protein phosphatase 4 regulatory subunit 1
LDPKREIRRAAYQNLGVFISSIKFAESDEEALDFLLSYYVSMGEKVVILLGDNNEMLVSCAFYFPGVLQTAGVAKWPKLVELYRFLLSQSDEVEMCII